MYRAKLAVLRFRTASAWSASEPTVENEPSPAYFEISFAPNVELVSSVRRFVAAFYNRLAEGGEAADMVALATHELLENAVRYAKDDLTHLRIEIERKADHGEVTIVTKNRARPEDIDAIREVVEQMAAHDPFRFYQQRLRVAAKRRDGSGLGLARVRAEAEMDVSCAIDGDSVVISGRAQFPLVQRS